MIVRKYYGEAVIYDGGTNYKVVEAINNKNGRRFEYYFMRKLRHQDDYFLIGYDPLSQNIDASIERLKNQFIYSNNNLTGSVPA